MLFLSQLCYGLNLLSAASKISSAHRAATEASAPTVEESVAALMSAAAPPADGATELLATDDVLVKLMRELPLNVTDVGVRSDEWKLSAK